MTITLPTISKTTLNGYLTAGMVICGALMEVKTIPVQISAGAGTVLAVLRIITGHLQSDADATKALVPDGSIQTVPAHPVPDNPADIAVAEVVPASATFPPATKE